MDEQRYHEILPLAYLAAAIEKGGRPDSVTIGLCARDLAEAEDEKSPAYRIGHATIILARIVEVKKERVDFGNGQSSEKFVIVFDSMKSGKVERQNLPTPLFSNYRFGAITKNIWDKWEPDGSNSMVGKLMYLYKHNDPPREGDKSSAGYRCCVYAEPRNN